MKFFHIILVSIIILLPATFFSEQVAALTISPVRMEISGDPGQTVNGQIELFNEQNETKTFYSSSQNFEARGDSGAPYFLPNETKGLASWITVQESVSLKTSERKKITFSVQIPKDAEAGGYFAAILWGTSPAKQAGEGQVSIGGKLGVLILLSVSGEIKEGGGLLDLKIEEDGRFVNALPITFTYRFSNDGSERIKPSGELRIKNIFGFTKATLNANAQSGNVLPGSIRKFSVVWLEKNQVALDIVSLLETKEKVGFFATVKNQWYNFALGPYKAELNLVYGVLSEEQATNKAKASYRFFVVPWQLLSIIIIILVVIGCMFWFLLKKYNRWITKKAMQQFGSMQSVQKPAVIKNKPNKEIISTARNINSNKKSIRRKKNV